MHILYGMVASVLGAFGALFLKKGAKNFKFSSPFNANLVIGFVLYVFTTVFFILGLQYSPLSFFYPFTALLYIFAALLGFFVLKEKITLFKLLGICLIILGILLNSVR